MAWTLIHTGDVPPVPWKNGGGATRTLENFAPPPTNPVPPAILLPVPFDLPSPLVSDPLMETVLLPVLRTYTMPIIELFTIIKAPAEMCFDLARDVDLHMASTQGTNERAVSRAG